MLHIKLRYISGARFRVKSSIYMLKVFDLARPGILAPANKISFSFTFARCGEVRTGAQRIGNPDDDTSFSMDELRHVQARLQMSGFTSEIFEFGPYLPAEYGTYDEGVLVIRNALDIFHVPKEEFYEEALTYPYDTQAWMRGAVKNLQARYNNVFADFEQPSDPANKIGLVVNFSSTKYLSHVRTYLPLIFGEKAENLVCEMNRYPDVDKSGIGFHGDSERSMVICLRSGADNPCAWYWRHRSRRISQRMDVELHDGDMYVMSRGAVGKDWKKPSLVTLVHAAGAKYIAVPEKKKKE